MYAGVDELGALGPFEVLRNAGLDARLVPLGGAERVTASRGARLLTGGAPREDADLLLVPGGGWNDRGPQGAWAQVQQGDLPRHVAEAHAAGTPVASVCTGGMILAAAGVLEGRPATTHHAALEELGASGAQVVDARVVDDGDVLTCGGVTSGLDLALWLVERHRGRQAADTVAREMEHDRTGRVWRRDG